VVEKYDFPPNLGLQLFGGIDFSDQKPLGKKPARLLAETDGRL
jgi:hypothetical protein